MNILPHAFAERMKYHIGSDSGNIFAAMKRMPIRGLRMNPMKISENRSMLVLNDWEICHALDI